MKKIFIVIPMFLLVSSIFIPGISKAEKQTFVDRSIYIENGGHFHSDFTLKENEEIKLHIKMEVSPDVSLDLMLLSESDFNYYVKGWSFGIDPIWDISVQSINETIVLNESKEYHLVIDNSPVGYTHPETDVDIDLELTGEISKTDGDREEFFSCFFSIGIVGITIAVLLIIILYFRFIREDKNEQNSPYIQQGPSAPPGKENPVMDEKPDSKEKEEKYTK